MSLTTGLTFPLLKISHATDSPEAKTFSWKHDTNDVRVLFDNYGAINAGQNDYPILTIFQGDKTLERVNLALKAREADQVVEEARLVGRQLNLATDLPVGALYVRTNRTIAIRYRLTESKIRRLQLKFETDRNFDQALALLEDLGCRPVPHGSSARNSSSTSANRVVSRPSSAYDPIAFSRVPTPTFSRDGSDGVEPLTSSHFPERPPTSHYTPQVQRPTSHAYQLHSDDWRRPPTPLFPIQEDQSFHHDPVMANIGGFDASSQRRRTVAVRPETSVATSSYEHPRNASGEARARPSSASKLPLPFAQLEDDLLASIPPRRELPFKRPASRQSIVSSDGDRPSSSADLPPLPKPSFINPLPVESSGPPKVHTTDTNMTADDWRPASARPSSSAATSPAKAKPATKKPPTPSPTKKKAPSSKTSAAKSSERPSTAASSTSTAAKKSHNTAPSRDSVLDGLASSPPGSVRNALNRIDAAMPMPNANGRTSEQEALANYADMKYEDRMSTIEKLMIENVQDENFITLCEDVHGCWQRIGFGR